MMQSRQEHTQTENSLKVLSVPAAVAAIDRYIEFRRSFDVTGDVRRTGELGRFLSDAISDFRAPILLAALSPERFTVTMTAVVLPEQRIRDLQYFTLKVSIGDRPVGESQFDLERVEQRNPNWEGAASEEACHPIDRERMLLLKRLLAAVDNSATNESAHCE